jgi:hypothetical protein
LQADSNTQDFGVAVTPVPQNLKDQLLFNTTNHNVDLDEASPGASIKSGKPGKYDVRSLYQNGKPKPQDSSLEVDCNSTWWRARASQHLDVRFRFETIFILFEGTPYSGVLSWWNLKSVGRGGVGSETLVVTASLSFALSTCWLYLLCI